MKSIKIASLLILFIGILTMNQAQAQTSTHTRAFEPMDGQGDWLKVVSVYNDYDEYDVQTTIYVMTSGGSWSEVELIGGLLENGDMRLEIKHLSRVSTIEIWMGEGDILRRTYSDDGSVRKYKEVK